MLQTLSHYPFSIFEVFDYYRTKYPDLQVDFINSSVVFQIFDGVDGDRNLLRSYSPGYNYFGGVPSRLISKSPQVIIQYKTNSSNLKSHRKKRIFNLTYQVSKANGKCMRH